MNRSMRVIFLGRILPGWKSVGLLLSFFLVGSVSQSIRSMKVSSTSNWKFQCFNVYCQPIQTVTVMNIRQCQMACLSLEQCYTAIFYRSTKRCDVFFEVLYRDGTLVGDNDTIVLAVLDGTRIPYG